MGATPITDSQILYWSKDKTLRIWDVVSEAKTEFPIEKVADEAPEISLLYTQAIKKEPTRSWNKGSRSVLRYSDPKADIEWHGEGFWRSVHDAKDTLMAINNKDIIFLKIWDGEKMLT